MLFNDIVFGPIHSRRLGTSLGINLMPAKYKVCNFNCCYCECGFNQGDLPKNVSLPSINQIVTALEKFAEKTPPEQLKKINSITFSGNGEPTLHPDFAEIAHMVSLFRFQYIPLAKISLLTNATRVGREEVQNAKRHLDNLILKLDSGTAEQYKKINDPAVCNFDKMVNNLIRFGQGSIIQTLLLRSTNPEDGIDNTTTEEFAAYMKILRQIKPKQIMLYGIDRETPNVNLVKIEHEELENYANRLRFIDMKVEVY
ncbi:MAG: radical SAM protein [Bacteroidales bacterium]|jgi:wyosine [tRNA(Phe)-imidazoG37] synthetase (radical SAM superfamily)|nr:radical SAM protein [Bacteroidales bacterium]